MFCVERSSMRIAVVAAVVLFVAFNVLAAINMTQGHVLGTYRAAEPRMCAGPWTSEDSPYACFGSAGEQAWTQAWQSFDYEPGQVYVWLVQRTTQAGYCYATATGKPVVNRLCDG